jgi:hypothetical protein
VAESIVQINEGTGKKLHTFQKTIGANIVEDEVVVLGENYLASYTVAPVANISTTTVNSHLLQIMAGASLNVYVRRIEVFQSVLVTTAAYIGLAVYRLTTAGTGGTVYTPSKLDTADAASGATAMTLPTVKGTEGVAMWVGTVDLRQTAAASTQQQQPLVVIDFDRPRSKSLKIAAGTANGIALKNTTGNAGASLNFTFWLDEANF